MSLNKSNYITDWKRLWKLVSGIHYETPASTVEDELLNVSMELQNGLFQFSTAKESNVNLEILLKKKKQEKLLPFTQQLQDLLDIESQQCWELLCYYLANEYRGSASLLTTLISTECNMTKLLNDIWCYYSLERMIVLKIVKNLLIFYDVTNHPYHREYRKIVDQLTLKKLRDSYLKQLKHLITDSPPSKLTAGEFMNYKVMITMWSERNAREINEVLHILLLICEHIPIELEQIKQLFGCFKQHGFGKQTRFLDASRTLHAELLTRLTCSEIMLFLKCIDFQSTQTTLARAVIEALEPDIVRMHQNSENGPLFFAWMLLNLRFTEAADTDERAVRLLQFGKHAVNLNCFEYMHGILSNSMFKDNSLVSCITRRTVYNLLTYMCDIFDGDGSCARHPFVYELLCELLSWPTLAKQFCSQEDGGVRSLYNTLLETFPLNFVHLSMLANSLTKGGKYEYIKCQLECLPILTEQYDECKHPLQAALDNDEYVLTRSISPYPRVDFVLTAGTQAVVMQRENVYFVHFRTSVNYFNAIHHEINCLLSETTHLPDDFNNKKNIRVHRIESGLQYLESMLRHTKMLTDVSAEMVHPTEMVIDLLAKFKTVQCPPLRLLANCLKVCTALVPLVDTEIITRVINLNILPAITVDGVDDFKKYAHGACFDSRLVGSYLVNIEKSLKRYDFFMAYLKFLRTTTKMQGKHYLLVEIPGLVFLLREVFPHMHAWHFEAQHVKHKIYAEVMGFICDILDMVATIGKKQTEDQAYKLLLRNICVYNLLNSENGLILLRFIALGNAHLQHTMEMESNWMLQQSYGLVLLVRLAMRILMQLLRLKNTIYASNELSPLESLICTQPKQRDTLRIVPVVTSYMSNIFDRWLPILSCRLIKRIALEFNMSLLSCLDMEPDQLRLTFLQKLPDELESDSLKIAVLEFVEACIEKQPGVTEAFFKVNFAQEKRLFGKETDAQIADSILTFIEDYLETVATEPNIVENTLPSRIMSLLHSLWKQNMQILLQDLIGKPTFWAHLCKPLFSEFHPNVRAYTQLLNILSIEVFSTVHQINAHLKKELMQFFEPKYFDNWLSFVFDFPETPADLTIDDRVTSDELPDWLSRLQAFKNFLLILLKKQPVTIEIPQLQLKTLEQKCFLVLLARAKYSEDLRPFIILSELYLYVISSLQHTITETKADNNKLLCHLLRLMSCVASCYSDLHSRAKESCLSIAIKFVDLLAEELVADSTNAFSFLHSTLTILYHELQSLENSMKKQTQTIESTPQHLSTNSLVLSLNLLKTVAGIFHKDTSTTFDSPIIVSRIIQRLLSCLSLTLHSYPNQNLSLELLAVLIVFAKSKCSKEFLYYDIGDYLWLKLLPPKILMQVDYTSPQLAANDWTIQKWWPIYAHGIELVTLIYQKHNNQFITQTLQFVGIHQEYLADSLLLGKQSFEPQAMNLIKSAVTLVSSILRCEKKWQLDHPQSFRNLMRSVQILTGQAISMFHQPRNLKHLSGGRSLQLTMCRSIENADVDEEVVNALNNLTEILIQCTQCLQSFSPDLVDLICEPELTICRWEPIFNIHFGAPKLADSLNTLSFGTVLSIVGVFTKVLNLQNYGFHEKLLNILPNGDHQLNAINTSNSLTINPNDSRSFYSKSISVSSTSSANCPPKELLYNLNSDLCLIALEKILMLAASQSLLALKNSQLLPREKQIIKREISSELLAYHEFVRRKVLSKGRDHKEMWLRKKHGQLLMQNVHGSDTDGSASAAADAVRRRQSLDVRNSMRVNVVRRLHLQQQQQQQTATPSNVLDKSNMNSPYGIDRFHDPEEQRRTPVSSIHHMPTDQFSTDHLFASDQTYRDYSPNESYATEGFEIPDEEDIELLAPEEPRYSPLSNVQLVEEDYLHFMSNLFIIICQSD